MSDEIKSGSVEIHQSGAIILNCTIVQISGEMKDGNAIWIDAGVDGAWVANCFIAGNLEGTVAK